jgi:hypothetical protein
MSGGGGASTTQGTASEAFYWNLLILINTCLFIETISFFMSEIKMAVVFRFMTITITSIPIINHFVLTSSPFAYCYNHSLMSRLLMQLFIEDTLLFLILKRASFLFYHLLLVFTPLFLLYSVINKEQVSNVIQRMIQSAPTSMV